MKRSELFIEIATGVGLVVLAAIRALPFGLLSYWVSYRLGAPSLGTAYVVTATVMLMLIALVPMDEE